MTSEFDKLYESLISELYTMDNKYLRDYFRDRPLRFEYTMLQALPEFLFNGENDDIVAKLSELVGTEIEDGTDLTELEYDSFYSLPKDMLERISTYVDENHDSIYNRMEHDMPSIYHFDKGEMVPRLTWLIHFSDDAGKVKSEGFKYGTMDMENLGLTTMYNQEAKKFGGYNFAFEADSKEASWAAAKHKYGKHAVMFQNSGTKAYHWGDQENQVMFWGPDVNPQDLVVLRNSGGEWEVERQDGKGSGVAFKGEFKNVVDWVMANYAQYRKVIT